MQEQESDSPSIGVENDPVAVDTQTVDSPVQQTTNGKEVICLVYLSATNMNQKSSLMLADTNVESLEPIQPDTFGASSTVPSSQIEAILEKVPYLLHHLSCYGLIQSS